jgi:hypothetical protein
MPVVYVCTCKVKERYAQSKRKAKLINICMKENETIGIKRALLKASNKHAT